MAKTWVEKRDCGKQPQVKILDKSFAGMKQGCKMLISSPQEVDEFIRGIPQGMTLKPKVMQEQLAKNTMRMQHVRYLQVFSFELRLKPRLKNVQLVGVWMKLHPFGALRLKVRPLQKN